MVIYPIRTERLSISPLAHADLDQFVAYRQDPQVAKFQGWDTSYSKEQALQLLAAQQDVDLPNPGTWLQLALHKTNTQQLVGDLALHRMPEDQTAFELGFTVATLHQGNGYAKEGAAALIDALTSAVTAQKFIAHIDRRNLPAAKLLASLEFVQVLKGSWKGEFKGESVLVDCYEKTTA